MPNLIFSPERRIAEHTKGKTDDQIADSWATENPKFGENLRKIRTSANNDPRATTSFLNYYLHGDANYTPPQAKNAPVREDTSIGWFGANAAKRFLDKTWTGISEGADDFRDIKERYATGEIGLPGAAAQTAFSGVSQIASPAVSLWDVALTSDFPLTDTSAADVLAPVIEPIAESKPVQEGIMPLYEKWQSMVEENPELETANYAAKAMWDAVQLATSGVLQKPLQATVKTAMHPIKTAKDVGKGIVQSHPIEAARNLRAGAPTAQKGTESVGAVTAKAMERAGVDPRVSKLLTEGGADLPQYKRIIESYESAAKDFKAANPKEIIGETALMNYRHLESLREGVGGLIGNVVKSHATEPIKLGSSYSKYVSWLETRGVFVNKTGRLERIGSSVAKSDLPYLQSLHNDILKVSNFNGADSMRRVIFKEQNLAERHGISYGDDAKMAASRVHSDILEEMGASVPAYKAYAQPYAKIKLAQDNFAKKLGKGSRKELDLRQLRAGEVAKRMTGNASADMQDAFALLEDTAKEYGYAAGTSSKNQALFEQSMSQYFPTYSPGGLTGQIEAALPSVGTSLVAPKLAATKLGAGIVKKLTGNTPERQLKIIKDFLESNSGELARATNAGEVETILQKMFGENYVAPSDIKVTKDIRSKEVQASKNAREQKIRREDISEDISNLPSIDNINYDKGVGLAQEIKDLDSMGAFKFLKKDVQTLDEPSAMKLLKEASEYHDGKPISKRINQLIKEKRQGAYDVTDGTDEALENFSKGFSEEISGLPF